MTELKSIKKSTTYILPKVKEMKLQILFNNEGIKIHKKINNIFIPLGNRDEIAGFVLKSWNLYP